MRKVNRRSSSFHCSSDELPFQPFFYTQRYRRNMKILIDTGNSCSNPNGFSVGPGWITYTPKGRKKKERKKNNKLENVYNIYIFWIFDITILFTVSILYIPVYSCVFLYIRAYCVCLDVLKLCCVMCCCIYCRFWSIHQ